MCGLWNHSILRTVVLQGSPKEPFLHKAYLAWPAPSAPAASTSKSRPLGPQLFELIRVSGLGFREPEKKTKQLKSLLSREPAASPPSDSCRSRANGGCVQRPCIVASSAKIRLQGAVAVRRKRFRAGLVDWRFELLFLPSIHRIFQRICHVRTGTAKPICGIPHSAKPRTQNAKHLLRTAQQWLQHVRKPRQAVDEDLDVASMATVAVLQSQKPRDHRVCPLWKIIE